MYLTALHLLNFKNYAETQIDFRKGVNCLTGNNASGKTNILDAIHYLSMCRSYFTTSDYANPGYRFKASTITVYPNNRVVLHNMVLYAGSVPIFYFPYFVYALDDKQDFGLSSGTQIQAGSKSNWGFFLLNSYTTRISEDLRPTFRFDYRVDRGVAGGMDLRYKAGEPYDPNKQGQWQPRVSGKIKTYYADDKRSGIQEVITSTGTVNQKIPSERFQVESPSEQIFARMFIVN